METHKFKLGQVVLAESRLFGALPTGRYTVLRLLPPTGLSNQYRVKCLKNGHERVVQENEIFRSDH